MAKLKTILPALAVLVVSTVAGCYGASLQRAQEAAQSVRNFSSVRALELTERADELELAGDAAQAQANRERAELWQAVATADDGELLSLAAEVSPALAADLEGAGLAAASTGLTLAGGAVGGTVGAALLVLGRAVPAVWGIIRRGRKYGELVGVVRDVVEAFERAKEQDPNAAKALLAGVKQKPQTQLAVDAIRGRAVSPLPDLEPTR